MDNERPFEADEAEEDEAVDNVFGPKEVIDKYQLGPFHAFNYLQVVQ